MIIIPIPIHSGSWFDFSPPSPESKLRYTLKEKLYITAGLILPPVLTAAFTYAIASTNNLLSSKEDLEGFLIGSPLFLLQILPGSALGFHFANKSRLKRYEAMEAMKGQQLEKKLG